MGKRAWGQWALGALFLCGADMLWGRDLGVDVSHFQGETGIAQSNWDSMASEGKTFAFIKATEGLTGPDDGAMATNVARAATGGLAVGVYHYAHAENRPTTAGAVLEADHFVDYAGSAIGPGRLRPVLDIEGSSTSALSTTALTDWVIAFNNQVALRRGAGAVPIIYCLSGAAATEFDSRVSVYDLWVRSVTGADPQVGTPPDGQFTNWTFWQYEIGSAGGISPIDLNVLNSGYKSLSSLIIPTPEPASAGILLVAGAAALLPRRTRRTE
jgi:lysozyme